eukprot:1076488-Pleurochrysis_carterae.AAC.2
MQTLKLLSTEHTWSRVMNECRSMLNRCRIINRQQKAKLYAEQLAYVNVRYQHFAACGCDA